MRSRRIRWGGALVAVIAASLVAASGGSAAGDSLMLTASAPSTDASGFTITASGSATHNYTLVVAYRSSGNNDCSVGPQFGTFTNISPDGAAIQQGGFNIPGTTVTLPAGTYLICGWLQDSTNAIAYTTQTTVTLTPADTMSLTPDAYPVEGRALSVTAQGTSYDGNALIDSTYKPAGGSCALTPSADTGTAPSAANGEGAGVGAGSYSTTALINQVFDRGSYLICSWLVNGASNGSPILAAASTTVTVRPVSATLKINAPSKVDPGQEFPLSVTASLDHGVPVRAIADVVPVRKGTSCAPTPSGEPTSATGAIDQQLTGTKVPAGSVSSHRENVAAPLSGKALVCAWLEAGWTQSALTPRVLAGPVSATIAVGRSRIYRGTTSQHHSIVITVAPIENAIVGISETANLRCNGRATFPSGLAWDGLSSNVFDTRTFGRVRIGRTGAFKINLDRNSNHAFDISGRLQGKRITGTLNERAHSFVFTDNNTQNVPCSSGTVRFSARTS